MLHSVGPIIFGQGLQLGISLIGSKPSKVQQHSLLCLLTLFLSLSLLIDYAAAGAVAQPSKSSASSEHIYLNSPQMRAAAAAAAGFYPAG